MRRREWKSKQTRTQHWSMHLHWKPSILRMLIGLLTRSGGVETKPGEAEVYIFIKAPTSAAHGASQTAAPLRCCTVNKPLSTLTVYGWWQQPHSAQAFRASPGCKEASLEIGGMLLRARLSLVEVSRKKTKSGTHCRVAPPRYTIRTPGWVWAHGEETRPHSSATNA